MTNEPGIPPNATSPLPTPQQQKPKRSTSKIVGLSAIGVVLVLIIALIGGELWARHRAAACFSSIANGATKTGSDVSFSKSPMLLQLLNGKIKSGHLTTKGDVNGIAGLSAILDVKDLKLKGNHSIGSATLVGTMSLDGVKDQLKVIPGLADGATVTPDTSTGIVDINATVAIFNADLQLKPEIQNGKLVISTVKLTAAGFGIPNDIVNQFISGVTSAIPNPAGLPAQSVYVDKKGIHVTYKGTNLVPQQLSTGGQQINVGKCSVF